METNILIKASPTSITSGRKAVTAAGTAEQIISSATACAFVEIMSDIGNVDLCVVGDANVVAALDSQKGMPVIPGNEPQRIFIDDASKLYVDSIQNGDAVTYNIFAYND